MPSHPDQICTQLFELLRDVFEDDAIKVNLNTKRADVEGWDSLGHVRLIVAVEQTFGVRFSTSEATRVKSVGELTAAIGRKLAQ
jgi:acyl carrier protein